MEFTTTDIGIVIGMKKGTMFQLYLKEIKYKTTNRKSQDQKLRLMVVITDNWNLSIVKL